jgi:hypothetical protein
MLKGRKVALIFVFALLFVIGILVSAVEIKKEEATSMQDFITDSSVKDDMNSALAETEQLVANDTRAFGFSVVTFAQGWMTNNDNNTRAEVLTAVWISKSYLEVNSEKVKQVRQQYKDDPDKLDEELKKLASDVKTVSWGRIYIGEGEGMEKLKLVKKEMTNDSALFYVTPMSEKYDLDETNEDGVSVGSLSLEKKYYPDLLLWQGVLKLEGGKYIGEWQVYSASKTKTIKKLSLPVKKTGFWEKLMFWKRNS